MQNNEMSPQEQAQAIEKAREVGAEFNKLGPEADANNTFSFESAKIYKDSGLGGVTVPKEFGGLGGDILTLFRVGTELARGDAGIALGYNMHQIMVGIMGGLLTDEQKKEWFPRIADGDLLCGIFSEARAGFSGLADTKAVPQPGGGWKLYGQKNWGTLIEVSDIWSGSATITDADGNLPEDFEARVAAESNFIAALEGPGQAPGMEIEKTWDALGMRASGTQTVVFDGFYIPEDGYAGEMRGGIIGNLEWASLTFASVYYGIALRAYEETKAILRKKNLGAVFGATVGSEVKTADLGYIQEGLGRMLCKNEVTRRVCEDTCKSLIEGADENWDPMLRMPLIGLAKVVSTENCLDVVRDAMRLVGGASFRRGHPLERLYRDAAAGPFQPLTSDQTYSYFGGYELAPE